MNRTQDFLPIIGAKDDVALLRNGDLAIILETTAVNFGLLSAGEQYAIISAFAGMLNSLSFSIQIVIRSKRLDVTDYLKLLDEAYKIQNNPLLASMMLRYRRFIETTVRENEVLDKQFFIVIGVSYLEMGLTKSSTPDMKRALTLLLPRADHIGRQLSRIGLRANQLTSKQITELFYDIYNFDPRNPATAAARVVAKNGLTTAAQTNQNISAVNNPVAPETKTLPGVANPIQSSLNQSNPPSVAPTTASFTQTISQVNPQTGQVERGNQSEGNRARMPFVVEELSDDTPTMR